MSWKTRVRQSLLMLGLALCAAAAPAASVGQLHCSGFSCFQRRIGSTMS